MNELRNSVRLFGNVGQDPSITYQDNGSVVANLSLAVTERIKGKDGEWSDNTSWFNLTAWGDMAKNIEKNVHKGTCITVHGRLATDSWEKDGVKKYKTYVRICEFLIHFTGPKRNEIDELNHM